MQQRQHEVCLCLRHYLVGAELPGRRSASPLLLFLLFLLFLLPVFVWTRQRQHSRDGAAWPHCGHLRWGRWRAQGADFRRQRAEGTAQALQKGGEGSGQGAVGLVSQGKGQSSVVGAGSDGIRVRWLCWPGRHCRRALSCKDEAEGVASVGCGLGG